MEKISKKMKDHLAEIALGLGVKDKQKADVLVELCWSHWSGSTSDMWLEEREKEYNFTEAFAKQQQEERFLNH